VDAEKIEHGERRDDQGLEVVLVDGEVVGAHELFHGALGFFRAHGFETDVFDGAIFVDLEDPVVDALPLPALVGLVAEHARVELLDGMNGERHVLGGLVDHLEAVAVPGDLLLGAVAGLGVFEDERAYAVGTRGDALDTVGRFAGLDPGDTAQGIEHFGCLTGEEGLHSLVFTDFPEGGSLLRG